MSQIVIIGKILGFDTLDRQGEIITADCDIDLEQNIPLKLEWGEEPQSIMGFATTEKRPDGIWATMTINDPNDALKKLTPCIGGSVFEKETFSLLGRDKDDRQFNANLNILKRIKINSIGLCQINVDSEIKTLEEMENDTGT